MSESTPTCVLCDQALYVDDGLIKHLDGSYWCADSRAFAATYAERMTDRHNLREKIARALLDVVCTSAPDLPVLSSKVPDDVRDAEEMADAVLAVLDLDTVRAAAQVEVLRSASDDITLSFSRGMVLATATECHKKQCRCGNPAPEELARQIAHAYRDQIRDDADRIAREAGIETGGH